MTVSSLAKGTRQSPHGKVLLGVEVKIATCHIHSHMFHLAIAEIMKYQNKSFIAVAGKVAAIHEEIDKLKELYVGSYGNKTIKLAGK